MCSRIQIRRLPVPDRDKHLIGVVSPGNWVTQTGDDRLKGESLAPISDPAQPAS